MDNKLLMVKTITLIYLSTKAKEMLHDLHKIVSEVMTVVKPPENSVRAELTYDIANQLRNCINDMLRESSGQGFNEDELEQRFKLISQDDVSIYEALTSMLIRGDDFDLEKVKLRIDNEYWNIKRFLEQEEVTKVARNWSHKLAYNPESINWETFLDDIKESFTGFSSLTGGRSDIKDHPAVYAVIDFSKKEDVQGIMTQARDALSAAGSLKCGMRGFNRMCGEAGGFRRGETLLYSALRNKYKTGFSRDLFNTIPLCNLPYMYDETKKPLNIRISLEDMPTDDVVKIYQRLRQGMDDVYETVEQIDASFASEYIQEKLGVNGYTNVIVAIDPTGINLDTIIKLIEQYERQGFEVHHLNIDYLAMLSKSHRLSAADQSQFIQNLFTKIGNVCRRKRIFCSTPHQLSGDAKEIFRSGVTDFVKQVAGKSMYDGSRKIDQEVEMEITLHIEKCNGESYLTAMRGKHRGMDHTPEEDQYTAYKFRGNLGIPYDFFTEDQSLRKVGGDIVANGGASPLWDI